MFALPLEQRMDELELRANRAREGSTDDGMLDDLDDLGDTGNGSDTEDISPMSNIQSQTGGHTENISPINEVVPTGEDNNSTNTSNS